MNLRIEEIAVQLPERRVTNHDLQRLHPDWDMSSVEARSGVHTRHFAGPDETALDLAHQACRRLFEKRPEAQAEIDALIFCTQTSDYFLPANACILQSRLNLEESVFAFDLFMGCSGFINGLSLAFGLIRSGQARNLILVTADTLSKRINPGDRSVSVLFGDGAAATWLRTSEKRNGLMDIECSTAGQYFDKIIIPAGGCRSPYSSETSRSQTDSSGNLRTAQDVHMDGLAVLGLVNTRVPDQIHRLLFRNGLSLEQIDFFIFHQASKVALDSITRMLQIDPARTYQNISEVGNTVSASIPIALRQAIEKGLIERGELLLLSGFGVGLAWGTALLRLEVELVESLNRPPPSRRKALEPQRSQTRGHEQTNRGYPTPFSFSRRQI